MVSSLATFIWGVTGSDIRQHGRFKEGLTQSMPFTAQQNTGTLRNGVLNMFLDFRHCGLVDQRTLKNTWLEAVADFKFLDRGDEFLGKGIINAGLDVKSVGANAGLTGVAVFGNIRPFDRGIQIGVVENEGFNSITFSRKWRIGEYFLPSCVALLGTILARNAPAFGFCA